MANCGQLTWRAKKIQSLNRPQDNQELWNFAHSWIQRFRETNESNVAEKMIYLWVTVNAWASKCVPDLSQNHIDAYLVHCMAKDNILSENFNSLYKLNVGFREIVDSFLRIGPIFQALWLNNKGIRPWNNNKDRREFVNSVSKKEQLGRGEISQSFAFSPECAFEHFDNNEPIPADWPHLLSMIYRVRCNLFHGGKNYNNESDKNFIKLAYKILWEVWKSELPIYFARNILPWNRVLIRSGFIAKEADSMIYLSEETNDNIEHLQKIIEYGEFGNIKKNVFNPTQKYIEENVWLRAVDNFRRGVEGGLSDDLCIMDKYVAGMVRWLNAIGIKTSSSCDGHGISIPRIECRDRIHARIACTILNLSGHKFYEDGHHVSISHANDLRYRDKSNNSINYFLDISEWLYLNQNKLASIVETIHDIPPASRSSHQSFPR